MTAELHLVQLAQNNFALDWLEHSFIAVIEILYIVYFKHFVLSSST